MLRLQCKAADYEGHSVQVARIPYLERKSGSSHRVTCGLSAAETAATRLMTFRPTTRRELREYAVRKHSLAETQAR